MSHTPGPWRVGRRQETSAQVFAGNGRLIADCNILSFTFPNRYETCEANARLVAAAPDLLNALNAVDGAVRSGLDYISFTSVVCEQVRAALAKATAS